MQTEVIAEALTVLNQSSPDIEGSLLVAGSGEAIACVIDPKLDHHKVAAMAAALGALGQHCGLETDLGEVEHTMIKGSQGYFLLVPVGSEVFLSIRLKAGCKPGLILLEARTVGERIRNLL